MVLEPGQAQLAPTVFLNTMGANIYIIGNALTQPNTAMN